jgi:cytochrome c
MRALAVAILSLSLAASAAAEEGFTTLKGHGGPVMGLDVDPGTGRVASASFDNSVGLWQGRDPRWLEGHRAAVNAVRFLPGGGLASAGDDFAVILWQLGTGAATRLEGHRGKVVALAAAPGGGLLASAGWDGRIGLWPLDGGVSRFLDGHAGAVNDVAFAGDGRRLFSASADGTIRVWTLAEGQSRVLVDQGFGVNRIVLGPDDAWLAYGAVDGATRIVDPRDGTLRADFSLDRRPILALAHHGGAGRLAVGDGHGYIMVIDTRIWNIARDFRAMRDGPVWALAFSPDGTRIHAGGLQDVVYSWPLALLDTFDPAGGQKRSFLRDPAEMPNGERQFMRKCSICHALTPPPSRKAGPTLHGIFGRRAGTVPGYGYSSRLAGSDIVWTAETIDALFAEGPDHYIPGSKMPMQRITDPRDRQDLIGFLRRAASEKEGKE